MNSRPRLFIIASSIVVILILLVGGVFLFRNQISNFFLNKAQDNILQNNLSLAKIYLNVAETFNGNSAYLHFLLGKVDMLENNEDSALMHFNTALELGYSPYEVLPRRAAVFTRKGDLGKAITDYLELISLNPNDLLTRYRLAYLYFGAGEFKEAADEMEGVVPAISDDSSRVGAYNFLGRIYYLLASYKLAVTTYGKSLELNPNQPLISVRYARALRQSGDTQGAITEVNKVLATNPNYAPALCALSGFYAKSNEYDKSIATAQKALANGDINAGNIACLYHSALAYYDKGNSTAAKSNLESLLDNFSKLSLSGPEYQGLKTEAQDLLAKMK